MSAYLIAVTLLLALVVIGGWLFVRRILREAAGEIDAIFGGADAMEQRQAMAALAAIADDQAPDYIPAIIAPQAAL